MLVILGFAGLSLRSDGISLDPKLPANWRSLAFAIQWRGRSLKIKIGQDKQRIEATLARRRADDARRKRRAARPTPRPTAPRVFPPATCSRLMRRRLGE